MSLQNQNGFLINTSCSFAIEKYLVLTDNVKYLEDCGVKVVFRTGFHQKFTVIDGRLSWYGSVNILSFGKSEESVMRLESPEIAGELIDTITRKSQTDSG